MNKKNIKFFFVMYFHRLFHKKNLLIALLLFILINVFVTPLKDFSIMTDCKITPWVYPFLISDANFLMIFMAGIVYFYSGVPFTEKWEMYYLIRINRKTWIKDQILYIICSAYTVTIISVLLSWIAMIPHLTLNLSWGKIIFTLAKTDASKVCNLFWKISAQYLSKHEPITALLTTIFVIGLGITFCGLLMYLCSLFLPRYIIAIIPITYIVYSSIVANVGINLEKKLALFSPVSWMRITHIGITQNGYRLSPSLLYIISMFLILNIILIFLILLRGQNMDVTWMKEEE